MVILDLYCGAGGAAMGYSRAGFDVVGVDLAPQPRYPFHFVQADALLFLSRCNPAHYRAIHASPPCQAYSHAQRIRDREHPDLIGPTRDAMKATGLPYVIENVEDARPWLRDPQTLCGAMFPRLRVYRHRLFETSWPMEVPAHPSHTAPQAKMGRPPKRGEFMHVVGHFSGAQAARDAMDIPWMVREELREAIPPAYTEHVGRSLVRHLTPALT